MWVNKNCERGGLPQAVCEALKQARKQEGATQGEIALRAGVVTSYISQIEAGNVTPSVGVLIRKIAPAYGIGDLMSQIAWGDVEARIEMTMSPESPDLTEVHLGSDGLRYLMNIQEYVLGTHLTVSFALLRPGEDTRFTKEMGEKVVAVLKGEIELTIFGERHNLKAPNVVHFKTRHRHRFFNCGNEEALLFVVIFPRV